MSPDLVRVLIATTQGPVEVEAILDLEPGESSIVALGSSANIIRGLVVSYRNFVAKGSGVVARSFGHDAFRLELSGEIHAGDSWQLAVFFAHALHREGRLAAKGERARTVVWATGQIDYHLRVAEIGHVPEKIIGSLGRLADERAAGAAVYVVWPKANGGDADDLLRERLLALGVTIDEAEQAGGVLGALGLTLVEAAGPAGPVWNGSPYRGLAAFGEAERPIFFGRGRAREEALARLRTAAARGTGFLLVHGSSGAGKSSLARAGLLGDIAAEAKEADDWRSAVLPQVQPDRSPMRALAQAIALAFPDLEPEEASGREDRFLADMSAEPAEFVARIVAVLNPPRGGRRSKLVLLLDQFEDFLLWGADGESVEAEQRRQDRDRFAGLIERLAKSDSVWVLATLRSDLLTRLEDCAPFSRLASDARLYRLERPNRAALRDMVLGPARLAGLALEGEDQFGTPLAEVLVEAAARSPDSLPLLQFALARLYDLRDHKSGIISAVAYERIGGFEGAIGQYAEETIVAGFGDEAPLIRAVEDVILALARPSQEDGVLVARTLLIDATFETSPRRRAMAAMVEARLLTIDEGSSAGRTVRVTHEALLTHWPRAQRLLEGRRSALELRERLEAEAKAWDARARDPSYLLQAGHALAAAQHLVEEGRIDVSPNARAFVTTSAEAVAAGTDAQLRRLKSEALAERRRRQFAVAAALVLFVIAGAAGWLYLRIGRIDLVDQVIISNEYCLVANDFVDDKKDMVDISGTMMLPKYRLLGIPQKIRPGHKKRNCMEFVGINYKIEGTISRPDIKFNPLFALSPSFIRKIWSKMSD